MRRIFVRAVSSFYLRRARGGGLAHPNAGSVVFAQRFDSGLRLNLHFHGLWLDGAFACPLGSDLAHFDPHGDVTDRDVEPSLLLHIGAAAIEGRTAFGERRGARQAPLRRAPADRRGPTVTAVRR